MEPPLSPERTAVLSDLHWLVHQGHVVEYANGQMEIAPTPQPVQPKKKKPKPDKKLKAETPTVTEVLADASATNETKSAEPPASEISDTTEPPEPSQATEPTELVETSTVTEESPVQDDSPSGEVPVKVAE